MTSDEQHSLSSLLSQLPLFQGINDDELAEVAACAQIVELAAEELPDWQSEPEYVYILLHGSILLSRGAVNQVHIGVKPNAVLALGKSATLLASDVTASSSAPSRLIRLPWHAIDALPRSGLMMRERVIGEIWKCLLPLHLLSIPLFRGLDETYLDALAADSQMLSMERGESVMRQGERPNHIFVVISGSLEVFKESAEASETAGAIDVLRSGECVGEMGVLLGEPRSASVRVRRDAVLIRISAPCFEQVLHKNAELTIRLARTLSARLKRTTISQTRKVPLRTIALLPCCETAAFDTFRKQFAQAFENANQKAVPIFSSSFPEDRFELWLRDKEASDEYLLFICDRALPQWTRQSLRRADLVLCVGQQGWESSLTEFPEDLQAARKNGTRVELALLTMANTRSPQAGAWLKSNLFDAHHLVAGENIAGYERIVRRVRGEAWGLVLSGGGARGFAHIGVIQALQEGGIPIDMIAGTSMGAILGAQYAMDADPVRMLERTRSAYVGGSSWSDLTIPFVSLRTGGSTMSRLQEIFGDWRIEDLPTPFFCVSCNLTRATAMIHDSGPVAHWTRVSCSVPGLLPPVPCNGDLLVDGGLLNNLPVEAMRKRLGGSVIASNVSVAVDLTVQAELSSRTAWSATTQLLRKFRGRARLPTIVNLLMRTAEVSSVRDSRVSGSPSALHLELPVSQYSMTDFAAIDRLVELGYEYTTTRLRELKYLSSTSS